MDTKVKENPEVHIDEAATIPLVYHEVCMTRNHKTVKRLIIGWACSLVAAVLACAITFAVMWLQYDYVGSVENTGVYVLTDSEGNVIANDLDADDVVHIMELLNDGEQQENPKAD